MLNVYEYLFPPLDAALADGLDATRADALASRRRRRRGIDRVREAL